MLRTISPDSIAKNKSIITNWGCSHNCWYCIWQKHPLKNVCHETNWDKLEKFLTTDWLPKVSVSGGGDCLSRYEDHIEWWDKFFSICYCHNIMVDVHSRTMFREVKFWRKVNRAVFSLDLLTFQIRDYLEFLAIHTKIRVVHVITRNSTLAHCQYLADWCSEKGHQITFKKLEGWNDNWKFEKYKELISNATFLESGDYNLYYFPNNTIGTVFMRPPQ